MRHRCYRNRYTLSLQFFDKTRLVLGQHIGTNLADAGFEGDSPRRPLFAPGFGLDGASKAAISAFVRGWARELGPKGITVNAIPPGPIDTEMNPADSDFAAGMRAMMPLTPHGRPEKMAALALSLAGDEAAFITGARVNIDGGVTA